MSTTYYYDSDDGSSSCCSDNDHFSCASSDMSMMVMDDIIEHLKVMRHQEVGYQAKDYLSILGQHEDNESDNDVIMSNDGSIDEACRTAMSNWMYTVVDTLKLPREAVTIAMSYVDRFLSTKSGLSSFENRMEFQLTCMTCFYMAVKVHSPVAIDTSLVSQLSRHQFTPEQVEQREMDVLTALKWKVNPPTALSFIEYFRQILALQFQLVDAIEEDDNDDMFDAMYDLAKYQVEVSTNNYMLSVGLKPSMVALAAVANALETIDMVDTTVQNEMITMLMSSLMMMTATEKMNTNKIFNVRTCLYETVTMAGNNGTGLQPQPTTTKKTSSRRRQKAGSPPGHSANNKHRSGMNCSGSPRSVTLQQHQQQPTAVST
eukprot:CAMPEP_0113494930 /NCGR_PEP_ID=MMETSP0014_2-20120614/29354_1 /TAXON_ID=2857 /ORGANISM="Nitzschia sp." /LENGTH=373 /DNA_ID=CAMNT_0000388825 /DNA_START=135 /DNA_END=1256 /DNA_ORIENTATION=+ /assembly_acc=CAM_ASM_000159